MFLSGENEIELRSSIGVLVRGYYLSEEDIPLESLKILLNLEKKIVQAKGSYKKMIEDTIFEILESLTFTHYRNKKNEYRPLLGRKLLNMEKDSKEKFFDETALEILECVIELFHFNLNRDSYRSIRKQKIIVILCNLMMSYYIPQAFDLCLLALESKKTKQIEAAIEFYQTHFDLLGDKMKKDIIEKNHSLVSKAKKRSTAITALQFLVEINEISEMTASNKIDEWEENNDLNYV